MRFTFRRARLALATLTAGVAAMAVATPAQAVAYFDITLPKGMPTDCFNMLSFSSTGRDIKGVTLTGKQIRVDTTGDTLPYAPLFWLNLGGHGEVNSDGSSSGTGNFYAPGTDGKAHAVEITSSTNAAGDTTYSRVLENYAYGSGWLATRSMTMGSGVGSNPYSFYRLDTSGNLLRYTTTSDGKSTSAAVKMFNGAAGIKSIAWDRTISSSWGEADVLLAGISTGELREYIIPKSTPSKWWSRTIRPAGTGWAQFDRIRTGSCGANGRSILAHSTDGQFKLYYDANAKDFSGADITGGATGVSLPTSYRIFQQ